MRLIDADAVIEVLLLPEKSEYEGQLQGGKQWLNS